MPPRSARASRPKTQADKPVGEWNAFEITLKGDRLTVVLNGKTVIENAELPGIPDRGPIALQHHGGFKDGKYLGPPSLVQFREHPDQAAVDVEADPASVDPADIPDPSPRL